MRESVAVGKNKLEHLPLTTVFQLSLKYQTGLGFWQELYTLAYSTSQSVAKIRCVMLWKNKLEHLPLATIFQFSLKYETRLTFLARDK